jgi:hypothetical protein
MIKDMSNACLTSSSEVFGASEDEAPELDHSEDSENGWNSTQKMLHFVN